MIALSDGDAILFLDACDDVVDARDECMAALDRLRNIFRGDTHGNENYRRLLSQTIGVGHPRDVANSELIANCQDRLRTCYPDCR